MSNYDLTPQEFSDDADENLRIENEILKLKLQAEFGSMHYGSNEVPPLIENLFLQQVERFEREWSKTDHQLITVYNFLGRPKFIRADDLRPSEVEAQLTRIVKLLESKRINVYFSQEIHPYLKYKFLTEELFRHEMENISLPGMTMNFIYEEFHPEG